MPRLSRTDALEDISGWSSADVVDLLRKNGVEEACWKAVEKRQIDGDELLHLTEGKLVLWKSDLTRPLIWNLWTFVEELKKCPETYVEQKHTEQQQQQQAQQENQQQQHQQGLQEPLVQTQINPQAQLSQTVQILQIETLSDTESWDTDFEDSVDDPADVPVMKPATNPDFRSSLRIFQENDRIKRENGARGSPRSISRIDKNYDSVALDEGAYANCDAAAPDTTYANVGFALDSPEPRKNVSRLHSTVNADNRSLAEKLKEQLLLLGAKPAVTPKPEGLVPKKSGDGVSSFLYNTAKRKLNGVPNNVQKKETSSSPLATEALKNSQQRKNTTEDSLKNLPKPPAGTIRGFDLVANLPMRPTDDSEDDENDEEGYEAFDEQIVEQHQRMMRADSGQSLISSIRPNSLESVYRPPSIVSHDHDEVYEIYESITETPEENDNNFKNDSDSKHLANPPPLPAKPPPNITSHHNHLNKLDTKSERSVDKKSATLPHAGSNTSLSNAARPLPPPPDGSSYYERPWFHNLTREQANSLIEERCTYGNSHDGYFLMRPSTSNPNNPLTLVLWCKDRVYNVPVRRRPDNRYALGSSKPEEQSFASIDEIIPYYKRKKLVLHTGGIQTEVRD